MSVTARIAMTMAIAEVITSPSELAAVNAQHDFAERLTLKADSTAPATKAFSDRLSLAAGTKSVDLAALTDAAGVALNLTGLKVQAIVVKAAAANTSTITMQAHGTNGYNILGASGLAVIPAGGVIFASLNEGAPDVGASAKVIEFTSSDVDASFDIVLVAG